MKSLTTLTAPLVTLATLLVTCQLAAQLPTPSKIHVLGDSLSDTGRAHILSGGVHPGPDYPTPRATDNGLVLMEQLALALGVDPLGPDYHNYAVIGATTYDNITMPGSGTSLVDQVDDLNAATTALTSSDLLIIWIGANDINALALQAAPPTMPEIEAQITGAVDRIEAAILSLHAAGGRAFLIGGVPNVGRAPMAAALGQAHLATLGASLLNAHLEERLSLLRTQLSQTELLYIDLYDVMEEIFEAPRLHGITDTTTPCYDAGVWCGSTQHAFADMIHGSTTLYQAGAQLAYEALLQGGSPLPADGAARFLRGDVSVDGFLNVADAVQLLQGLFTGAPLTCRDAADVNDDGSVDISDPVRLLQYMFGVGAVPPGPFPNCASDPTTDTLDCAQPHCGGAAVAITDSPTFLASPGVVSGYVSGVDFATSSLSIDGQSVAIATDGSFAHMVNPTGASGARRITAVLTTASFESATDSVVLIEGAASEVGVPASDALELVLEQDSLVGLRDTVNNLIDTSFNLRQAIANHIYQQNPVAADYSGGFQYEANAGGFGTACISVDVEAVTNELLVRIDLRHSTLNLDATAFVPGPNPDCQLTLYLGNAAFEASFMPQVAADGTLTVQQTGPMQYWYDSLYYWTVDGTCDTFAGLVPDPVWQALWSHLNNAVNSALQSAAADLDNSGAVVQAVNMTLADLSLDVLGTTLGVPIAGAFSSVQVDTGQLILQADATVAPAPTGVETLAPPRSVGPQGSSRLSATLEFLNHMIADASGVGGSQSIQELDLGFGPAPLTGELLTLLFPALPGSPTDLYELVVTPTLPSMLTGAGAPGMSVAPLVVPAVRIELLRSTGDVLLEIEVDVAGRAHVEADVQNQVVRITPAIERVTATAVRFDDVGADPRVIDALLAVLVDRGFGGIPGLELPVPQNLLVDIELASASVQAGSVHLFGEVAPPVGRADLIVSYVQIAGTLSAVEPATATVWIKNVGTASTPSGSFFVPLQVHLSIDDQLAFVAPGNIPDLALWGVPLQVDVGNLAPGEDLPVPITIPAQPFAVAQNQHLIFCIDNAPGVLCEGDEGNNCHAVDTLIVRPDLEVVAIDHDPLGIGVFFDAQVTVSNSSLVDFTGPITITQCLTADPICNGGPDDFAMGGIVDQQHTIPAGGSIVVQLPQAGVQGTAGPRYLNTCVSTPLFQSDVTNDCLLTPVVVGIPDLEIQVLNTTPTGWVKGQRHTINTVVTNVGNGPALIDFNVAAWITSGPTLAGGPADVAMGYSPVGVSSSDPLDPGESRNVSYQSDVTATGLTPGPQHLIVQADFWNVIPDSNPLNNFAAYPIAVQYVDLVFWITSPTAQATFHEGQSFPITFNVTNQGTGHALGSCTVQGVLDIHSGPFVGFDNVLVGQHTFSLNLAPQQSQTHAYTSTSDWQANFTPHGFWLHTVNTPYQSDTSNDVTGPIWPIYIIP
ncbi:MAG: CARDB domain-containing protein [Planctomycetota bacterium]